MDDFTGAFLIFLATVDPVSTLAIFVGLTSKSSPRERTRIAFRTIGYSAILLMLFIFFGQLLLGSLGIRLEAGVQLIQELVAT